MIALRINGVPQPAGSKRAFIRGGKAVVVDDCEASRGWKDMVAWDARCAMREARREPTPLPVRIFVTFYRARPKCHLRGDGTVKDGVARFPVTKPDATKLLRAVEDALTGVCYVDDAQVIEQHVWKSYGDRPGVTIEVWEWDQVSQQWR